MKGDFTRDTFRSEKHFRQALMQQGRVQLDADWNEETAITARRDETTTADVVGRCGGPADNAAFWCFADPAKLSERDKEWLELRFGSLSIDKQPVEVSGNKPTFKLQGGDFFLSSGRYYVDGVQCENEFAIPYTVQPDRFGVDLLETGSTYLVYLDVWERHVTALDDSTLLDCALGGVDTATRVKTVWQVRVKDLDEDFLKEGCSVRIPWYENVTKPSALRLTARTVAPTNADSLCQVPETAGYKGLENQLYRVEIHRGSPDETGKPRRGRLARSTFKWSRENGSIVSRLLKIDGMVLTVESLGRGETPDFAKGQYAEILDDSLELDGIPGDLIKIADVNPDKLTITLERAPNLVESLRSLEPARHPKVRRWDGEGTVTNQDHELEAGILVRFEDPTARCRTGDYWQIPARTATATGKAGDIEWPCEVNAENGKPDPTKPLSQLHRGVTHHYCRLGFLQYTDVAGVAKVDFTDCRCLWPALSHVPRLFYVSGDGQEIAPIPEHRTEQGLYKLERPLIVGMANGHCIQRTWKVRFTVVDPDGALVAASGEIPSADSADVPLKNGLAQCDFHLNGTKPAQQVRARLLDAAGEEVSLPIFFNANLSIASEVAYNPPDRCAALEGQNTVQGAITRLATLASIYKVSGDGQQAAVGETLGKPLRVYVASPCGPVKGMKVTFSVVLGGGSLSRHPAASDAQGNVTCEWTLGPGSVLQVVQATLDGDDAGRVTEPTTVHFIAHLAGKEDSDPELVRVVKVELLEPHGPLPNDATIPCGSLGGGLAVLCDGIVDESTVSDPERLSPGSIRRGQPTCFITAEIPFPLSKSDFEGLGGSNATDSILLGYRPFILHAVVSTTVRVDENSAESDDPKPQCRIQWIPDKAVLIYLSAVLTRLGQLNLGLDRLLLRLTLKGNFIWARRSDGSSRPDGFLDGEAFRASKEVNDCRLLLPSGDGRRGGDFEMWFWLTRG